MKKTFHNLTIPALFILILALSGDRVFAQSETIENLTIQIEKNPQQTENYLKRAALYKGSRMLEETALENTARAVADYTSYLKVNPRDAESYRLRAAALRELFAGANPLSIADLKRALQIAPQNNGIRQRLAELTSEYRSFLTSPKCRDARRTDGFQGHPSDEPMTYLGQSLEPEMEEDRAVALKYIA